MAFNCLETDYRLKTNFPIYPILFILLGLNVNLARPDFPIECANGWTSSSCQVEIIKLISDLDGRVEGLKRLDSLTQIEHGVKELAVTLSICWAILLAYSLYRSSSTLLEYGVRIGQWCISLRSRSRRDDVEAFHDEYIDLSGHPSIYRPTTRNARLYDDDDVTFDLRPHGPQHLTQTSGQPDHRDDNAPLLHEQVN
jgi:hypothetical protein